MQRKYIPLLVLLLSLLLLFASLGARITAAPVFSIAAEKTCYLTFDDGPSTVVTGRILDTLKREKVKATFFIVGDRVYGREETLRRIAREGHSLGVHSMSHEYNKIYASEGAFLQDIRDCAALIFSVTGIKPTLYRFPGGGTHAREKALAEEEGFTVVGWNAVCGDGETAASTVPFLLRRTKETAAGKDNVVLLLHDAAYQKATAEALPAIISLFRAKGYTFCAF